jgi:nitrogen fixation protein NifQ
MEVLHRTLLLAARDPADPVTRAFAGALETSRTALAQPLGLEPKAFRALVARYFPAANDLPAFSAELSVNGCPALRAEEYDDLLQLLLEYRSDPGDETSWLAGAVAAACLGSNHLWQDLGLANRQELSELLKTRFATLYARNTGNMKWKKFFYKQLCDRAGVNACRAPSCQVCDDYRNCFGSEDEAPAP